MIPNNVKEVEIVSSLDDNPDNIISMGMSENAIPYLMILLSDMYSDNELACVREYSTNAFDSHIMAGQTKPIEVFTPTPLSPFLRIKDYGVGMDRDTIANIYAMYGEST